MTPPQPSPESPSEFSFDLYPGLGEELDAAFAHNMERGRATTRLAAVIGNTLRQRPEILLSEEVQKWVREELGGDGALNKWRRYDTLMPVPTPELDMQDPKLVEKYNRLHMAKRIITEYAGKTPKGKNAGETMHLLLIPWQAFKEHIDRLPEWVNQMRRKQDIYKDDYFNNDLLEAIDSDQPIYKVWEHPNTLYTAREYLDDKISQDGPWGILLAQTSNEAGIDDWRGQSPDDLTRNGTCTPLLEGQPIGSMGIFEWLAVTLQQYPQQLSRLNYSWLLANRLTIDGDPQVPFGDWNDDQVGSGLSRADDRDISAQARLAVI